MGGCASSKYAVDEDKQTKKDKKPNNKKGKSKVVESSAAAVVAVTTPSKSEQTVPKAEKDELEFIDKEDTEKQQQSAKTAASKLDDDDVKKETTTYQTTVVKHTQKEGEELMQHLKDEAFKTLQNLLKQQTETTTTTSSTTTASSSANATPETSTSTNADPSSAENIVEQIKSQVNKSLGNDAKKELVDSIIDSGIELIRDNKVKSMGELQAALESKFPANSANSDTSNPPELVKKVVNATTGFLTAKGTEAGALLSSILANVSSGLQGVMNETEKTTVKVTRTVTEQLMSGGQINEITKVITRTEPTVTINPNINEILRDLTGNSQAPTLPTSPSKVTTNTGNLSSTITSIITEKLDTLPKDLLVTVEKKTVTLDENQDESLLKTTKQQAEQVVSTIVSAAVEKVQDEDEAVKLLTNGHSETPLTNGNHPAVEVEVKVNGSAETNGVGVVEKAAEVIEDVQNEFYKQGKKAAEEVVKKLTEDPEPAVAVATEPASETA